MLGDIEGASSKRVLLRAQRVEVQKAQKIVPNNIKEAKEFDSVKHNTPEHNIETQKKQKE